jgi:hypothetical protein
MNPLAGLSLLHVPARGSEVAMTNSTSSTETQQGFPDDRESLAREHARLSQITAALQAEHDALRQRPINPAEHRAFAGKLQAHIDALQEHARRIRSSNA